MTDTNCKRTSLRRYNQRISRLCYYAHHTAVLTKELIKVKCIYEGMTFTCIVDIDHHVIFEICKALLDKDERTLSVLSKEQC